MTSRDFAYFLQGFFEITKPTEINSEQTEMIKKHLSLVFKHEIDPSMGDQKHQGELNKIHNSVTKNDEENLSERDKEGVQKFGPKPGPNYQWNIHGWYDPEKGVPRC